MLVVGMNRLRAAYVEIDPWVKNHLVTGLTDDSAGIQRTYTMGIRRSGLTHFLASTFVFAGTVNTIVAAGLGAVLADSGHPRSRIRTDRRRLSPDVRRARGLSGAQGLLQRPWRLGEPNPSADPRLKAPFVETNAALLPSLTFGAGSPGRPALTIA